MLLAQLFSICAALAGATTHDRQQDFNLNPQFGEESSKEWLLGPALLLGGSETVLYFPAVHHPSIISQHYYPVASSHPLSSVALRAFPYMLWNIHL